MRNPGDYSLADIAITTAFNAVALTPVQNLEGIIAATILARFAYGSGGTSVKTYVQVTLDDGQTWIDVACFSFTTASATRVINLSGLTPKLTALTPSDGALADDTFVDGILGSAMRLKLVSVGIYANTILSVKLSAR